MFGKAAQGTLKTKTKSLKLENKFNAICFLFHATINLHRYLDHAMHAHKEGVFLSGTKQSN